MSGIYNSFSTRYVPHSGEVGSFGIFKVCHQRYTGYLYMQREGSFNLNIFLRNGYFNSTRELAYIWYILVQVSTMLLFVSNPHHEEVCIKWVIYKVGVGVIEIPLYSYCYLEISLIRRLYLPSSHWDTRSCGLRSP